MKTNYRLFLFIAGFISFSACGQTVSHDKAIEYYITVAAELKNSSTIVNDFWHETFEAIKTAQQNQEMKLDSSYINTLIKSYQISTLALSKSIEKLSAVVEIDQSINLKARSLTILKDTKTLHESSMPIMIKVLSTGLGKPTHEERESFEKFILRVGELQTATAELEKLALDFQDKHKITSDELNKYGL